MDRKTFSIIIGLALIVSFFLPLFGSPINASGWDIVQHAGASKDAFYTYIWLVFPICGLMLLLGAMRNNYPGGRGLWTWLPLLALLFILILYPVIKGASIGNVFKSLGQGYGVGLWIAIVASVLAAFYNPRG